MMSRIIFAISMNSYNLGTNKSFTIITIKTIKTIEIIKELVKAIGEAFSPLP